MTLVGSHRIITSLPYMASHDIKIRKSTSHIVVIETRPDPTKG